MSIWTLSIFFKFPEPQGPFENYSFLFTHYPAYNAFNTIDSVQNISNWYKRMAMPWYSCKERIRNSRTLLPLKGFVELAYMLWKTSRFDSIEFRLNQRLGFIRWGLVFVFSCFYFAEARLFLNLSCPCVMRMWLESLFIHFMYLDNAIWNDWLILSRWPTFYERI